MKKLSCRDIDSTMTCNFEATGNSPKDVVNKLMSHMKNSHPEKLKEMDMTDDELMAMFEAKVHD